MNLHETDNGLSQPQEITIDILGAKYYAELVLKRPENVAELVLKHKDFIIKNYFEDFMQYFSRVAAYDYSLGLNPDPENIKGSNFVKFTHMFSIALKRATLTFSEIDKEKDIKADGKYIVRVNQMTESHRLTYWVVITNPTRKVTDNVFNNKGKITPFYSENVEHANIEATQWAEFLEVEPILYII